MAKLSRSVRTRLRLVGSFERSFRSLSGKKDNSKRFPWELGAVFKLLVGVD